jgi:hypothetical protein
MNSSSRRTNLWIAAGADQEKKEFLRQKTRLRDAILRDEQLTRAARRIGYEIADLLNCKTGDAWPSQEYLAKRTGYSVKSVERATKKLDVWFQRNFDGKSYRYVAKFDQLAKRKNRQYVGRQHPTFATETPDICDRSTRQNVGLSSLVKPKREPSRVCGQESDLPAALSHRGMAEREGESPIAITDRDQAITAAAVSGGAPRFAFEGSEPWRAWNEYRERKGIGPLPTRQQMVGGRWRTGSDVPTLWPPGYRGAKRGGSRNDVSGGFR